MRRALAVLSAAVALLLGSCSTPPGPPLPTPPADPSGVSVTDGRWVFDLPEGWGEVEPDGPWSAAFSDGTVLIESLGDASADPRAASAVVGLRPAFDQNLGSWGGWVQVEGADPASWDSRQQVWVTKYRTGSGDTWRLQAWIVAADPAKQQAPNQLQPNEWAAAIRISTPHSDRQLLDVWLQETDATTGLLSERIMLTWEP